MVFDFDGEPLVGGIERGAFGHRPAAQRAFPLEAEIPVQPPRGVLLDHEDELFGLALCLRGPRAAAFSAGSAVFLKSRFL